LKQKHSLLSVGVSDIFSSANINKQPHFTHNLCLNFKDSSPRWSDKPSSFSSAIRRFETVSLSAGRRYDLSFTEHENGQILT